MLKLIQDWKYPTQTTQVQCNTVPNNNTTSIVVMTSDNETVSRQTPWAGNIAKTMTSNGKQFTVTREMLTAVARDQSVLLKVAWCCRKHLTAFFKICFCFVLLYNKSLNDWSLGKQRILFPSNLNVCLDFVSAAPTQAHTIHLWRWGYNLLCVEVIVSVDMWLEVSSW